MPEDIRTDGFILDWGLLLALLPNPGGCGNTSPTTEYEIYSSPYPLFSRSILRFLFGDLDVTPDTVAIFDILYSLNTSLSSSIIVACSSTNIFLRPMALFRGNPAVLAVLLIIFLGHWGLALGGAFSALVVQWNQVHPPGSTCAGNTPVGPHGNYGVIAFYLYTLIWDIIIMAVTIIGLLRQKPMRSSPLWSILRRQGLEYVLITTCLNLPALAFSWMNLNGTMNIIFTLPGGIISVMVSSAAVVALFDLRDNENEPPNTDQEMSTKSDVGGGGLLTSHVVLPSTSIASSA
ncbi:hypothetical protein EIP91_008798 [Steccherinum ochraceum]|uniref:G-protein coupled receptors family 1 profile domain-containing protein n=1 Tax=Steccherinum ochraceum TaxID=92696 RepID=A0A4R0R2C1_9APHY|nr:hypothetical protein EIP91_008798 [Steccherinum ochraceum]